jgi:hypothetical protein
LGKRLAARLKTRHFWSGQDAQPITPNTCRCDGRFAGSCTVASGCRIKRRLAAICREAGGQHPVVDLGPGIRSGQAAGTGPLPCLQPDGASHRNRRPIRRGSGRADRRLASLAASVLDRTRREAEKAAAHLKEHLADFSGLYRLLANYKLILPAQLIDRGGDLVAHCHALAWQPSQEAANDCVASLFKYVDLVREYLGVEPLHEKPIATLQSDPVGRARTVSSPCRRRSRASTARCLCGVP